MFKKLIRLICISALLFCTFYFEHSTPERAIRTNIIFSGHAIKGIRTTVNYIGITPTDGPTYYCNNPEINPHMVYNVNKKILGLWFVTAKGIG